VLCRILKIGNHLAQNPILFKKAVVIDTPVDLERRKLINTPPVT